MENTSEQGQPQFQNSVDVKLDYIQRDVKEIKDDIKIIQRDFVNRREFNEAIREIEKEIAPLKKVLYGALGLMGIAVLGALLRLVIINS